jgi:hypothetical protein
MEMSMGDFFAWVSKPLNQEDVDIWFNMNNMSMEKRELYGDIVIGLVELISSTYLGDDKNNINETRISLSQDDVDAHFNWCWVRTIDNLGKENINLYYDGKHKEVMKDFLTEIFYNQTDNDFLDNLVPFFENLFSDFHPYSKSDLDIITNIYKSFEKSYKD